MIAVVVVVVVVIISVAANNNSNSNFIFIKIEAAIITVIRATVERVQVAETVVVQVVLKVEN